MKKISSSLKHIIPYSWKQMGIFCGVFFCILHSLAFGWHQFLVYRYDRLSLQAEQQGTTLQMPHEFLAASAYARERTWMTRPDVLAREAGILQTGIRSLIYQYKNDFYRLHDTIVQHIQYLKTAHDISRSLVFPGSETISPYVDELTGFLSRVDGHDIAALTRVADRSSLFVADIQRSLDFAERRLVLQDILGLGNELIFLADVYRMSDTKTDFDVRAFQKDFRDTFDADSLRGDTVELLREKYDRLQTSILPYRHNIAEIRTQARIKRQSLVDAERERWDGQMPPSPLPERYSLIYVSLRLQTLFVYEDGDLILSTPITSGRNQYETIRGTFALYGKQRGKYLESPFTKDPEDPEYYKLWVDYWLPFHGAYGIHDACNSRDCWRTRFGVPSYVTSGSHGCVNTPHSAVKFIYSWARIGTTVHVD